MSVRTTCPQCGQTLTFPDTATGKRGQCAKCRTVFTIMASPEAAAAQPPAVTPRPVAVPLPAAPAAEMAAPPASDTPVATVPRPAAGPPPAAPAVAAAPLPPADDFNYLRDLVRSNPGGATGSAGPMATGTGSHGGFFAPEKKGISYGLVGGIIMMAIAVVWFVVGYHLGWIFYYPPVLFIIGVFACIKGIATGNIAGNKR